MHILVHISYFSTATSAKEGYYVVVGLEPYVFRKKKMNIKLKELNCTIRVTLKLYKKIIVRKFRFKVMNRLVNKIIYKTTSLTSALNKPILELHFKNYYMYKNLTLYN